MKYLILLLFILCANCTTLLAQDTKSQTIMLQLGTGSFSPRLQFHQLFTTNLLYEDMFYRKNNIQLGAAVGGGLLVQPAGWFGIEMTRITGNLWKAAGCFKIGKNRHYLGVDAGYAYVTQENDFTELTEKHHVPVIDISYQYYAPKGFHLRAGLSYAQGIMLGFGKSF